MSTTWWSANAREILSASLFLIFTVAPALGLFAQADIKQVTITEGQSRIFELTEPVKRVSIAYPEVADVSVISPTQVLVNGKAAGVTSLIVWNEREKFSIFKLVVQNERSPYRVTLNVRFSEVNRTALRMLGVNFLLKNRVIGSERLGVGSFAGKINTPSNPFILDDNVNFFLSVPTQNLSAIFKALEEKNLLTTLAKPNLSTMSGSEASFLAGGEFPIPIVSGIPGQQTVTIQFKEFGIRLKFTPTVLDSGFLSIKLASEVSSLDFERGLILNGFRIPSLITRKAEATVELRDGEQFIIGGLLSTETAKTTSRIPGLGHIPVLGKLFSSSRFQKNESELLIMITPQLVPRAQPVRNFGNFREPLQKLGKRPTPPPKR